jgi:hypothetical protein
LCASRRNGGKGGGIDDLHPVGDSREIGCLHAAQRGVSLRRIRENVIAGNKVLNARSDGLDNARNIHAENGRKGEREELFLFGPSEV